MRVGAPSSGPGDDAIQGDPVGSLAGRPSVRPARFAALMPTPAKLAAALLFAALAWVVADAIVRGLLEPGQRVGWFREVAAAGAVFIGWRMIGREATGPTGRGTTALRAITAGIAASAVLLMLGVLLHSFGVMISYALDRKYNAIGKAVSAWMEFLWRDLVLLADPLVLGLLFGGGALVGAVAGAVGRRMR